MKYFPKANIPELNFILNFVAMFSLPFSTTFNKIGYNKFVLLLEEWTDPHMKSLHRYGPVKELSDVE